MIVAEELDARLADVDVPLSDARQDLGAAQSTGGSTSVRSLWDPVRQLAAAARARLVTAAAQEWNVPATTLSTHDTAVWAPDGRTATYGSLTAAAARVLIPAVSSDPKPAAAYAVVGQPTGRVDARDIVTGKARYALDVAVTGALPTVVARPPTINGAVLSYDATVARSMPGVVAVTQIPTGVAVTAETFDQAMKAVPALAVSWGAGSVDGVSDADVKAKLTSAIAPFAVPPLLRAVRGGDVRFRVRDHAPLEVRTRSPTCGPTRPRSGGHQVSPTVAAVSRSPARSACQPGQVTVHVVRGGGSFGHRIYSSTPPIEAAQVSKAIGRPVKLMWTRNDDMRHGRMRPRSHHQIRATYCRGNVLTYEHRHGQRRRSTSPHGLGEALIDGGLRQPARSGPGLRSSARTCPYNFGVGDPDADRRALRVAHRFLALDLLRRRPRTANEIMVDEFARSMGKDPVAFRLRVLQDRRRPGGAEQGRRRPAAGDGRWHRGTAQGVASTTSTSRWSRTSSRSTAAPRHRG